VRKDGALFLTPTFALQPNGTDLEFYRNAANLVMTVNISGVQFPTGCGIAWTGEATLTREASNSLGLYNATTAQKFRIYNTRTTIDTAGEWFKLDWATTSNQFRFGAVKGSSTGTARVATWDYGGVEATPTAAITVPATSGALTFGGGIILPEAGNLALGTVTGTKIGTATNQLLAFFNATPVVQQTRGGTLTNNVTSGGTTDQIDDFTSLTIYATDAAAIRNDIFQLARAVRQHDVALRALGLEN